MSDVRQAEGAASRSSQLRATLAVLVARAARRSARLACCRRLASQPPHGSPPRTAALQRRARAAARRARHAARAVARASCTRALAKSALQAHRVALRARRRPSTPRRARRSAAPRHAAAAEARRRSSPRFSRPPAPNTELTPEAADMRARARRRALPDQPQARRKRRAAAGHRARSSKRPPNATASELIAEDYFAHVSPSGETPVDRIRDTGYIPSPEDGYVIGENLAWGTYQLSTPQAIVAPGSPRPGISPTSSKRSTAKRASASRPPFPRRSRPAPPAPPTRRSSASSSSERARAKSGPVVIARSLIWPDQRKEVVLTLS